VLTLAVFVVGTLTTEAARKDPGLPGNHLTIEEVKATLNAEGFPTQLTIKGVYFDFGNTLAVMLGTNTTNMNALTIASADATTIVASVPMPTDYGFGDYLLTVSTGNGQSQNDEYDLTIGAVGPQGEQGQQGEKGDTGDQGMQGAMGMKGDEGDPGQDGEGGLGDLKSALYRIKQTDRATASQASENRVSRVVKCDPQSNPQPADADIAVAGQCHTPDPEAHLLSAGVESVFGGAPASGIPTRQHCLWGGDVTEDTVYITTVFCLDVQGDHVP
jgi:hypothetical protein